MPGQIVSGMLRPEEEEGMAAEAPMPEEGAEGGEGVMLAVQILEQEAMRNPALAPIVEELKRVAMGAGPEAAAAEGMPMPEGEPEV